MRSLLCSLSLGLLIFFCTQLLREGEPPAAPVPQPNWAADFPARIERVTDALARLPWPLPTLTAEQRGSGALRWTHHHYEFTLPAPADQEVIEQTLDPLRTAASGVTLHVAPEKAGAHVHIGIDGLLTHTLSLHWVARRPRAAIVIDDLGNDLLTARTLAGINAPLTFAIMPARPFSREVAELAAVLGREVLLHLPMEAENGEDFGAQTVLRVTFDRGAVLRGIDEGLAAVPHAIGVNNHMGSRFTSDREHMQWLLERLKEKGLFFIDSRTTAHSVACEVAATIALPCAARSLFLDDADDDAAIRTQLELLQTLARTRGDVIAIGHARPATVAALRTGLPNLAEAGVDIVPVSAIVAGHHDAGQVSAGETGAARSSGAPSRAVVP